MIVRDEERNLPDCLASVAGLTDEIIVVDTGSTDRTREVAAELGATVFDFAWADDFSAARNEALAHATGDWIFWLDADDRIDQTNRQRLCKLLDTLSGNDTLYAMSCLSRVDPTRGSACWVSHFRLFPRRPDLTWRRRVHEVILPEDSIRDVKLHFTDIVIEHLGYRDGARRTCKLQRDLRLLRLDYALNPDDPLTLFYLGWTHLELGHAGNAHRFLRRALRRTNRIRKLYPLLAECLVRLGQRSEARRICEAGLTEFPGDPELLFHLGRLLGESGDLGGSEQSFLRLIRSPAEPYVQVGVEAGLVEKARFMLGLIYHEQGRYVEAESQYLKALAAQPDNAQAWIGLGQLHLAFERWKELAQDLENLARCERGDVYGPVLEARWRLAKQEFAEARHLLQRAIALDPQMLWPRLVMSDLVLEEGAAWEVCVQANRDILALAPDNALARERLEHFLTQARSAAGKPHADHSVDVAADLGYSVVMVNP
jgi:tetratricopeptide (TPR) repeat protein